MNFKVKYILLSATLFAGLNASATPAQRDTAKFSTKVKRGLDKAGQKTSELVGKGTAAIVDKQYQGKGGPNGENIYIDKSDHYYYVNTNGKKVYLKKSQLRSKPVSH
jgi:hypothetical protein